MAETDVRVLIPRIRRKLEGIGAPAASDDDVKFAAADAIADVILFEGSAFGKQLLVTSTDDTYNAPDEYATSEELTLPEGEVVAAQAALNRFFFSFVGTKISQTIKDEAQEWSYGLSSTLLRDQLNALIKERDKAIEALGDGGHTLARYSSFLAVRDCEVARVIEPFTAEAQLTGGPDVAIILERDIRFGGF